jgi:hypothetical protein
MKKAFLLSIIILFYISSFVSTFATTHTVTDGYFDTMTIDNDDTLIMTGGGGERLWGRGNSILDIRNTSSPYVYGESGINWITVADNSQLTFSSGSVNLLEATDNASVVLTGGQINDINIYYYSDNPEHVIIYCQPDWTYEGQYLSGLWLDNSPFNIRLYSQGATSDVFSNVTIIPEPTTICLFAVGAVLLKRRR